MAKNNPIKQSDANHWNGIFDDQSLSELGWYETDLSPSFKLINHIQNWQEKTCFLLGVGTSTLADEFAKQTQNIIFNDISNTALTQLKSRLGNQYQYLCQDISQPLPNELSVDIWLDRATLHFLTDEKQQQGYVANIKQTLKSDGYVLLVEFSTIGATMCAGLDIVQYNQSKLQDLLGNDFTLVESFNHTYTNPKGEPKPYIYALFRRKTNKQPI